MQNHDCVFRSKTIVVVPIFIIAIFSALPPIYAKDVYDDRPAKLEILISAIGIGGFIGGLITASLKKVERRGVMLLLSLLQFSLSLIGFAFSTKFWIGFTCLILAGFFEMIYITTNMTLIQLSVPDEIRGQVNGIVSLRSGLVPVGAFIAGFGSDLFGPRAVTIVLAGISGIIAIIVLFTSTTFRDYRLNEALSEME